MEYDSKKIHDSIILSVTKLLSKKEKRGLYGYLKFLKSNLAEFTLEKFEGRLADDKKYLAKEFVAVDSDVIQSDFRG